MTSFRAWLCTLKVYTQPASLRMLALGFSAGLPLLLVLGTLSFWLREAGIDRTTIGYLSWVGLAYAFKWVWAPLVDRLPLPGLTRRLGRRRSWLLLSQLLIAAGLLGMASQNPQLALTPMVWSALVVAFGSATQDIALDAYRIESASMQEQAALAATYQTGYRLAMIWAGAGVLWVATLAQGEQLGYAVRAWQVAYSVMAACMVVGIVTVLLSPEPQPRPLPPSRSVQEWLHSALVAPFADFIARYRWQAALVLGLIAVYRISDVVMGIMANPFYVDMGYTKAQVAAVTKIYGVLMTLLGGLCWRSHGHALGRDAGADAGGAALGQQQFAVCLAGRTSTDHGGFDPGGQRRQLGWRHCLGSVYCLLVQPDQCAVLGHAVRAVQLHDAAGPEVAGRVFGAVCGCLWL